MWYGRAGLALLFLFCMVAGAYGSQKTQGVGEKSASGLQLSSEEQRWLTQHPVVKVAGPRAFPPFYFYTKDDVLNGMAAEYLRLVVQKLNLKMEIQANLAWPQVLEGVHDKSIDLVSCIAQTAERQQYMLFSDPYLSFPLVMITKTDGPYMGGVEDLHGKKVAVVKKASAYEWLQRDHIDIDPLVVDTPRQALTAVSMGQADAHIENMAAATYLIEKHGLSNLKISGPASYGNYNLYMAVRNDFPELIPLLNKALASISVQQHQEIRNRWLSVQYDYGIHSKDLIFWVIVSCVGVCLLCTLFVLWNRRLRGEIVERRKAEAALKEQKSTLDSIFRVAPTGIGMVVERKIVQANAKLCQITGYSHEEMVNQNARMLYPTDSDYLKVGKEKYDQIKERGSGTVETRFQRKDGTIIDVLLSSTPVDVDNWLAGVTFTALDITDRKSAERRVQWSEERYRGIVEDQTELICRCNIPGEITFANSALCRFYGKSQDEVRAMSFLAFLPEEEQRQVLNMLDELTPDSPVYILENVGITIGEKKIWCHWTIRGIFDDKGRLIEIQAVGKDITARRDLEEKLRQAHKMEAIGTLSGGIAHDFNNILGIILGNAELARVDDGKEGGLDLECIDEIIVATSRARDLVNQLLTFSRKSDDKKKPMAMAPVVLESIKLLRSTLPTSIEFVTDIPATLPAVMADETQIHQVMINLCTNAADAMNDHGGVLRITLKQVELGLRDVQADPHLQPGRYLQLAVADTGSGIPMRHLRRIYDPYFTTKAVGKGTGLGLAVTHGIIINHGGGIRVTSEAGQGTVFELFWPVIEQKVETRAARNVSLPTGNESILIVDDEDILASAMKISLQKLGYRAQLTTQPAEALRMVTENPHRFDLVITDLTMPGMTGDKLAIAMIKVRPTLPVILCTGYSENMSIEKAKQLNIASYMVKPVQREELACAVRDCLDAARGTGG